VRPARYYSAADPERTARRLVVVVRPMGGVPPPKRRRSCGRRQSRLLRVAETDGDRGRIPSVSN